MHGRAHPREGSQTDAALHTGAIQVGSDADLVVVDAEKTRTYRAAELFTVSDYSPYDGQELVGWPVLTMLRGQVIYENGAVADATRGRYLPRAAGTGR